MTRIWTKQNQHITYPLIDFLLNYTFNHVYKVSTYYSWEGGGGNWQKKLAVSFGSKIGVQNCNKTSVRFMFLPHSLLLGKLSKGV